MRCQLLEVLNQSGCIRLLQKEPTSFIEQRSSLRNSKERVGSIVEHAYFSREEIAYVETVDNGKPILESRIDIQSAIDALKVS